MLSSELLELAYKIWLSLHLHPFFLVRFAKAHGDTAQTCSLTWFSAARICDKYSIFLNWPIKFDLSLHLYPFIFSAICKGSCETAPMCSLVWSFMFVYAILINSHELAYKKKVSMIRKYPNYTLQTNPRHLEEQSQNINSRKTVKVRLSLFLVKMIAQLSRTPSNSK